MEQLLHYVWKHKIFPLSLLQTTSGRPVEVIDPGLPNMNADPSMVKGTDYLPQMDKRNVAGAGQPPLSSQGPACMHRAGTPP